jgi:predicted MPP superfamily phosphohydrolase
MDIGKYFPVFSFARGVLRNRSNKKSSSKLQTETIDPYGWTIVCISDTHSLLDKIQNFPPADIIIRSGDFSNNGELEEIQSFYKQFSSLSYYLRVFIAGNHDLTLDPLKLSDINWYSQFEKCAVKLGMTVDSYIGLIMKIIKSNRAPQGHVRYLQDDSCSVSSSSSSESAISSSIKIYEARGNRNSLTGHLIYSEDNH